MLAILLLFFFLRDSDKAVVSLRSLAPRGSGDTVVAMARRAFQAVEGFMRGTTIIAFIDAVCMTVVLLILQVPNAVGLGALVFIGAYIPYLGALLSGAVAVLVAFADGYLTKALWVLGLLLVVQAIEGNVLQPMIHSRTVQMYPAVVLVALTAGASVAGILGMLLAVPLTAAAGDAARSLTSARSVGCGTARTGKSGAVDALLLTFGHSTADRDRIAELLGHAGVTAVVDVRTAPGSRRDPDLSRRRLAEWMPGRGIAYRWEPALGGFRTPPADSPDIVWRNASFRGYAAHTRSPEFVAALDRVLREAAQHRTAVMCSEAVWWRCHRRLIADFAVLARGVPAHHLMHDGRVSVHAPTPGARLRDDGLLVYDGYDGTGPGRG